MMPRAGPGSLSLNLPRARSACTSYISSRIIKKPPEGGFSVLAGGEGFEPPLAESEFDGKR